MSLSVFIEHDKDQVLVSVRGRFNYEGHMDFKAMVERVCEHAHLPCVVDLSYVQEMDSSALGLLLLMRDRLGGKAAKIRITGAGESTRKILQIANFQRYFAID